MSASGPGVDDDSPDQSGDGGQHTGDTGADGVLPEWVYSLKILTTLSALGIALVENPIGFFEAVVVKWAIGGLFTVIGTIATMLREDVWFTLRDSLLAVGGAIGGVAAVLGGQLLEGLQAINSVAEALASGPASPFAPVLVGLVWVSVAYLLGSGLRRVLDLATGVVPWL